MEFEKSRIEKLKRALYSRNENLVPKEKRTPVQAVETNIPTSWGEGDSFNFSDDMSKKNNSFFNRFLIISSSFFVLALVVSAFIFFGGLNMISSSNVDIKIVAPSSISSGEELDMGLSVLNQNRADLESVVLFVTYPEGSHSVDSGGAVLTRDRIDIGTVAQGKGSDSSIRAILFGEKGAVKTFTFKLEYKIKGSSAVFSKDKTFDVVIGSSPVLLNVDYPKEVNSGQEVDLSIDVTSNSTLVMQNTLVKIEYPYGFTYKDSSMKPVAGKNVWNVGDLKNGDKKTLRVSGTLVGQNLEDRTFRISAGTQSSDTPPDFDTDLAVFPATVGIRKSFFDLSLQSGNNDVVRVGGSTGLTIKWQNTLSDKIVNGRIQAVISGNVFDRADISAGNGGYYRSGDSTISWDKNSANILASISPGDTGDVSFSVGSLSDPMVVRSIKNPHIDISVQMTGDRSGPDTSSISSTADLTIKMESTLGLTSKSYRNVGPFSNTGPVPPRADQETTYTITWTITNTTNDLRNASVSATLPAGVVWKGEISPSSERIAYNPDSRQITWNIGNVSSGAGFTYSPKAVSFKVGLTPSVTLVGSSPALVSRASVEATDTYTETTLKAGADAVNTVYSDPGYKYGDETVIK